MAVQGGDVKLSRRELAPDALRATLPTRLPQTWGLT